MAKYAIRVEEVLGKTIVVEADNVLEAVNKVEDAVISGEVVLDYNDYYDRLIYAASGFKNGLINDEDVSHYQHI